MNEAEKKTTQNFENQGPLTEVTIPDEVQQIPGVETHHPEHDAVKMFKTVQHATLTHSAALATPTNESKSSNTQVPIRTAQKPGGGIVFQVVGSRSGKDWNQVFNDRQSRKGKLKHAA